MSTTRLIFFCGLILLISACANLTPGFEEPSVEVTSIRLQNTGALTPAFDIALRMTNPNRDALRIDGLTYTLYLAGNKLVSGVTADIARIPGYGETTVNLRATLSLLGGLGLLNRLMNEYQQSIDYELVTGIDVGRFYPKITIRQQGVLNF